MRLLLVAVLAVMVAGCTTDPNMTDVSRSVSRWSDPLYHVTCWLSATYGGKDISCLPDSEVIQR